MLVLFVVLWRVFLFLGLLHLVINPELRVVEGHEIGHALHRELRLDLLVSRHGAEKGDSAIVPIGLEMHDVPAQQNPSCSSQMHE
jgi:hypothetical protein